jgi:CrcB protein
LATAWFGAKFPWGTLFINISGSFVIGFFFAISGPNGRFDASTNVKIFVMTGLCGGYTTFSAFSLQTLSLFQQGDWLRGSGYIGASVLLCGRRLGRICARDGDQSGVLLRLVRKDAGSGEGDDC